MAGNEHVTDLLPAWALGCLDSEEANFVSLHIDTCTVCQAEFASYQDVVDLISWSVPQVDPPKRLKKKITKRITSQDRTSAFSLLSVWNYLLHGHIKTPVWIGLCLVFVLIAAGLLLQRPLNNIKTTLPLAQMNRSRVIPLSATNHAPHASGLLIIDWDHDDCTLVVNGLPADIRNYKLSFVVDGEEVECGVFSVTEGGYANHRVEFLPKFMNELKIRVKVADAKTDKTVLVQNVVHGKSEHETR